MSWLRSSSLRQSIRRVEEVPTSDLRAVIDSFCKHWEQVNELIGRSETSSTKHDDVLAVVNHLDYMVTLLLVELQNCNKMTLPNGQQPSAPCLEFMLSENLLDKLFEWSLTSTGKYTNAVRLEQLKLYELLVSHSRHQLLVHEPFLRPLLKLLSSCQNEIFPQDVGKRLVILLNQLCVVLMQNVHLLDLFFCSTQKHNQQSNIVGPTNQTNFIIFSLLIPYVHCDGSIGHQARDALLLCMSLSQKNSNIGSYIANHSSMSPVLVTGLCGLYSSLPNNIEILSVDWFRITADDVNEIPELTLFMNNLEFCNAVVQVAHPLIRDQLLDFLYQGFLVPVLGPAILQTNVESQIAVMVYLDLILRSVTDPGLLPILIKFLLDKEKFDGHRIIDVLIERITSPDSRLCMVTIALFDSLLELDNELIMNELILKYLISAPHIPSAQKHKINKIQAYAKTVDYFTDLVPEVMKKTDTIFNEHRSLDYHWHHYGLHTNGESLYSNYHSYLYDAHQKIKKTSHSCEQWANSYFYKNLSKGEKHQRPKLPNEQLVQLIRSFLSEFNGNDLNAAAPISSDVKFDSLQSIGESSGYESMKYNAAEGDTVNDEEQSSGIEKIQEETSNKTITTKPVEPWRISTTQEDQTIEIDSSEDAFSSQGSVSLGPFLTSVWSKLQTFTSNSLFVNIHLTGLLSHIALFPLPLVHSVILRPDIPTTSDVPSFYQVLKILKQQIDAELPLSEESLELIDIGRTFLIDREFKLINARKIALEALKSSKNIASQNSIFDQFKQHDEKRKGTSNSILNIFRRTSSAATPSNQGSNQGIANNIREQQTTSLDLQPVMKDTATSLNPTSFVNERHRDLAILAIILDEFLKELSAISQEMSIVLLDEHLRKKEL